MTGAEELQAELGWKWPVQQAIWHDLIAPGDNEWTTWSDAIVIAEKVADVLAEHGYEVVKPPPTVTSGVGCMAVRPVAVGGPDAPIFCHLIRGHDGPHQNKRGTW